MKEVECQFWVLRVIWKVKKICICRQKEKKKKKNIFSWNFNKDSWMKMKLTLHDNKNFHFVQSNVLFRNKFKAKKFTISLRFSFQFQSTWRSFLFLVGWLEVVETILCFSFVEFWSTHMWAVKMIPEVFCMFPLEIKCWEIMQHLFLHAFRHSVFHDPRNFHWDMEWSCCCNYIWKNNFSSHFLPYLEKVKFSVIIWVKYSQVL